MRRLGKLYICYALVVLCLGNIIVRRSPLLGLNLSVSCAADVVVVLSGRTSYTLMTFLPLMLSVWFLSGSDFDSAHILRYKTWKNLLFVQSWKILINSMLLALLFVVITNGLGYFYTGKVYNWGEVNSLFYVKEEKILHGYSFMGMLFIEWIFLCIRNIILQHIILLCWWLHFSKPLGTVVSFGICCCEIANIKIRLILSLFSIDYSVWKYQLQRVWIVLGIMLYITFFSIFYIFLTGKKEVYDEKI